MKYRWFNFKAEIWKLWPKGFLEHRPIFAGNSRSTGISQLRAGKTLSKRPRSHFLSTGHLLPYMWVSFQPLDPSRYLSSFLSWRQKSKNIQFFTNFQCQLQKKSLAYCFGLNFNTTDLPNRYTPKYSGVPEKLTWFQQFGLKIFPKEGDADFLPQKNAFFWVFFFTK